MLIQVSVSQLLLQAYFLRMRRTCFAQSPDPVLNGRVSNSGPCREKLNPTIGPAERAGGQTGFGVNAVAPSVARILRIFLI
jgi:hypothetical protein